MNTKKAGYGTFHDKKEQDSEVEDSTSRTNYETRGVVVSQLGQYSEIQDKISLTWKNVTYKVGEPPYEKTILSNVSGYVRPGEVCVILGPSGAGKTSLLSILSGTRVHTSGNIYYQGNVKEVTTSSEDIMGFAGNASYVAQDDTLMGSVTVEETLRYAAQLKITGSAEKRNAQVGAILRYLGLEKCKDTLVGSIFFKGISGGQKRRLSIGIELVTQPALLFLDEVTSGLDATASYQLMRVIAKLSKLGHSIIMTLHQPTSRLYQLMCENDFHMCILESGNMSYFGYAKDAKQFFDNLGYKVPEGMNATDYYLDLVDRDFQSELAANRNEEEEETGNEQSKLTVATDDQYKKNVEIVNQSFQKKLLPAILATVDETNEKCKDADVPVLEINYFMIQFWVLMKRNFMNYMRNPALFYIRLVMYAGLCWCLGTLYWTIGNDPDSTMDRISILFFVGAFLTFMSISAMPAFVEERAIYMRERTNNHYSTAAYALANFFSSIPWIFIIALVCSSLIYSMVQSRIGSEYYFVYLLNLFTVLVVAENMMVAISALTPYFIVGLAIGAGMCGLYMLVCGFFLIPDNIPGPWLWVHYGVSFHTYSFQNFMYNEFNNNDNVDHGGQFGSGDEILKHYDMGNVSVSFNFMILWIMAAFYRILFYALLKLFHRRAD